MAKKETVVMEEFEGVDLEGLDLMDTVDEDLMMNSMITGLVSVNNKQLDIATKLTEMIANNANEKEMLAIFERVLQRVAEITPFSKMMAERMNQPF